MANTSEPLQLTKRENQIMTILYRNGPSTIAAIARGIADSPSDTALRTLMRILEDKGYVAAAKDGRRNVYTPTINKDAAAVPALRHVLDTFFGGSLSGAVAAHLSNPAADVDSQDIQRLAKLVENAKKEMN